MSDKKETMAFLQAVLVNLEECDIKLSSIEDVIQKNAKLIEGRETLDFAALSPDEAQLVDKINAKYQELMIWTEDQKIDVSREIGRLTQSEKLAKCNVDDKELSSRIELYY